MPNLVLWFSTIAREPPLGSARNINAVAVTEFAIHHAEKQVGDVGGNTLAVLRTALKPLFVRESQNGERARFPRIGQRALPQEPSTKRTIVFIDDQNLFHAARLAYGYTYPQVGATKNGDPTDLECLSQNDKRFTRFAIGWSPRQGTIDQVAPANVRSPVPG